MSRGFGALQLKILDALKRRGSSDRYNAHEIPELMGPESTCVGSGRAGGGIRSTYLTSLSPVLNEVNGAACTEPCIACTGRTDYRSTKCVPTVTVSVHTRTSMAILLAALTYPKSAPWTRAGQAGRDDPYGFAYHRPRTSMCPPTTRWLNLSSLRRNSPTNLETLRKHWIVLRRGNLQLVGT